MTRLMHTIYIVAIRYGLKFCLNPKFSNTIKTFQQTVYETSQRGLSTH